MRRALFRFCLNFSASHLHRYFAFTWEIFGLPVSPRRNPRRWMLYIFKVLLYIRDVYFTQVPNCKLGVTTNNFPRYDIHRDVCVCGMAWSCKLRMCLWWPCTECIVFCGFVWVQQLSNIHSIPELHSSLVEMPGGGVMTPSSRSQDKLHHIFL